MTKRIQIDPSQRIVEPAGKQLSPVKEQTMYPSQFSIYLREQMQGRCVAEVAEVLGVKPEDALRFLDGTWKPSKDVCRRMGLKMVYALAELSPGDRVANSPRISRA